jgi:hypothetical protein
MNDPQFQPQRVVNYIPPAPEIVDAFAYKVCKQLVKDCDTAFMHDFSNFLKVVVSITAKHLSHERSKNGTQKI